MAARPAVLAGLPPAVKVGSVRLRFRVTSPRARPELVGNNGLCLFDERLILLDRAFFEAASPPQAANVVQHEVSHAICFVFGVNDGCEEEQFVERHTNGLIAVYHDNPKFAAWVVASAAGRR